MQDVERTNCIEYKSAKYIVDHPSDMNNNYKISDRLQMSFASIEM